jgi:hypothetical protein
MLEEVLRPAVRRLPEDVVRQVEGRLEQLGVGWGDLWRRWYRPGLTSRWHRRKDPSDSGRRGPWSSLAARRPPTAPDGPGPTAGSGPDDGRDTGAAPR